MAIAENEEATFEELATQMKNLPKLKDAFRKGALRALETTCYKRLVGHEETMIKSAVDGGVTIGHGKLQDLIFLLGLLSNHQGCEEIIQKLRKFRADHETVLSVQELKAMADEGLARAQSGEKAVENWTRLAEVCASVKDNADFTNDTRETIQKFACAVLHLFKHEARPLLSR